MAITRPSLRLRGFTIVELLIVIVIIGILAALVITAYNGIQARAHNTETITAVSTYAKALRQYAIDNNQWPHGSAAPYWYCLGEHSGVCGQSSTTSPACANGTLHCASAPNTSLNTALKPYYNNGTITPPNLNPVTITVSGFGGIQYRGAVVNVSSATASTVGIRYYLKGSNTDCGSPSGIRGTQDAGFSGDTSCRISIPNPN